MQYGGQEPVIVKNVDEVMNTPIFNNLSLANTIEQELICEEDILSCDEYIKHAELSRY